MEKLDGMHSRNGRYRTLDRTQTKTRQTFEKRVGRINGILI